MMTGTGYIMLFICATLIGFLAFVGYALYDFDRRYECVDREMRWQVIAAGKGAIPVRQNVCVAYKKRLTR